MFEFSPYAAWLIAGMTAVTFSMRLGGYVIGGFLPRRGRMAYVLDRLPAFVLIALLTPAVVELGWIGLLAAGVVCLIAHMTGRALVAMIAGVLLIASARYFGLL